MKKSLDQTPPTSYVMVYAGPDLMARLRTKGAHLRNSVVLRIAQVCRLKPAVVRRATRGGRLKLEHWECLAVLLRVPGLRADVKERWNRHLALARDENLRIKQAQRLRGGDTRRLKK